MSNRNNSKLLIKIETTVIITDRSIQYVQSMGVITSMDAAAGATGKVQM